MSKYFTPITELPGDSGKSESAAGMVRYKRSTSDNNKFSKSLSSDTKFVSPKKMFPESTKQSVPNSGKFLKRGTSLKKGTSSAADLLWEAIKRFSSIINDSTKDITPFIDEITKMKIPLSAFDELPSFHATEDLLPDSIKNAKMIADMTGDSAKIAAADAAITAAYKKMEAGFAPKYKELERRVLEHMYNRPSKIIAPVSSSTPYPRNIFEGWSQLTEGLSETANPQLFYANLTNKTGKLTNKNKKFLENLRDFYGNEVDTPEFNDALKNYYNGGDDDFFAYKGILQTPSNKGLYSTLATMKHNQKQIQDLTEQNAKGLFAQEKLSNGFDAAIKKPLVYGTVVGGTALAGKALYDWLNQDDSLDQIKNPAKPIIAPTETPFIPNSKFNFDLPVREQGSVKSNNRKLARMGKNLTKSTNAWDDAFNAVMDFIAKNKLIGDPTELKIFEYGLKNKSIDELTTMLSGLEQKLNLNLGTNSPVGKSTLSTVLPKIIDPKDLKFNEAKDNILRIMNINGLPTELVKPMETARLDPSLANLTPDDIVSLYDQYRKNAKMGAKFEDFLHNIGSGIDRAQGWADNLLGQSYRNQSIEDWDKLSNENKNRLIQAAKKIIPDEPSPLETEYGFTIPDSTNDLQNKALVDKAFSQGAYRFGRLNPGVFEVNSTPLERFSSNINDLGKNPQQKWARNVVLSPIIAPPLAYLAYKGYDTISNLLSPEPEPTSKNPNPIPSKYSPKKGESAYIDMLRNPPLVQNAKNIKEIESKIKELPAELPKNESTSSMAQIDIDSVLPKRLSGMAITNNPNQPKDFINDLLYGAMEGQSRLSNATLDPNSSLYDNPLSTKRNPTWNAYHLSSDDLKWMVDMALKNNENITNIPDAAQYLVQQDAVLKERQKINQENRTKQISRWADNRDIQAKDKTDMFDWIPKINFPNVNMNGQETGSAINDTSIFPKPYKPNYSTPDYLAYGVTGKTKKRASSVQKADSVWNRDKFYERKPLKTPDTPEYVTSTTNTRWDNMSDKEKGRMAATQALQEAKKKYKNTSDVVQHTIQRAGEIASNIGFGAIGAAGLLAESGISGFNNLKQKTKSSINFANGVAEVINEKNGVDVKEQKRRQKSFEDTKNNIQLGIKSTANNAMHNAMDFAHNMTEQSKPVIRNAINQSKPVIRNMINQSQSGISHLADSASHVSQDVINGISNWMQSNSSKGKTTKKHVEKSMHFQKSMTTATPISQNTLEIQKHRNKYIDEK